MAIPSQPGTITRYVVEEGMSDNLHGLYWSLGWKFITSEPKHVSDQVNRFMERICPDSSDLFWKDKVPRHTAKIAPECLRNTMSLRG